MTNFLTKKHDIPFPSFYDNRDNERQWVHYNKDIQVSDLQRVSRCGLKAQPLPSPGQAKRRPGLDMRAIGAPCKGKSLRVHYTFALTGRSYICLPPTQGAASLALG